ncbi:hypothetical protein K488DRAFT_91167 [Vararia minispora EC-137]|uniref:Uncharacterized protein n=1 Tax=Vararia minispora EC-137 TaxID=1314806 RepID=A0ACB8Q6D6_9AGAM|nr:hypothetical protein K488DRAFT_91167 [Vararia minispora EC-137]
MSSPAAARAAARRRAVLARGSDRLSKLTTSARGDGAPQFAHDDPPVLPLPEESMKSSLENFVGEETSRASRASRASPPGASSFDIFGLNPSPPDPSVWTPEQQQQFLRALMGGMGEDSQTIPPFGALPKADRASPEPTSLDALTSMMEVNAIPPMRQQKTPSRLQKLLPFIHLLSVWGLVAYYVLSVEPATSGAPVSSQALVHRWASLASSRPLEALWGAGSVPFIWAFATLELVLHSTRMFIGLGEAEPPMLLAMALPHLPPAISSTIRHGLKYLRMGSELLDDLAAVVFALAICVVFASCLE